MRLLEPGAGNGAFIVEAGRRLIASERHRGTRLDAAKLATQITAFEISKRAVEEARSNLIAALRDIDVTTAVADELAYTWIRKGDFLLEAAPGPFTHVVGNPPYIRWSNLPPDAAELYSTRLQPDVVKGDLCIAFFDRAAQVLAPGGKFAFVCTDRWLRSAYANQFRSRLSDILATRAHIDLRQVPAFDKEVSTYPSITLFSRRAARGSRPGSLVFYEAPCSTSELKDAVRRIKERRSPRTVGDPLKAEQGWTVTSAEASKTISKISERFPTLEEAGCRIRVGAAIGCQAAFVGRPEDLEVEPELLLPFVTTKDLCAGEVRWRGEYVINVFEKNSGLKPLDCWPLLQQRMLKFEKELRGRACVKNKKNWYRTIDRLDPGLVKRPKLLIPEISKVPHVAIDRGNFHPGNSLYVITTDEWSVDALHGILSVGVLGLFVSAHSPRVNGGYLRFYRHILRNVRIPRRSDVDEKQATALEKAAARKSWRKVRALVAKIYETDEQLLAEFATQQASSI